MRPTDLTGQRFGRLTAIKKVPATYAEAAWLCHCDCGEDAVVRASLLKAGRTSSCGCYRREKGAELGRSSRRHGEGMNGKETAEYRTWAAMLSRCENPNHCNYPHYGARGIKVCSRWHTYENFLTDMGRRPAENYSLDRISNNGDYSPENCRWASPKEQNRNRRGNRWVNVNGVTKTLAEWFEIAGLNRREFYRRIAAGMTPEQALSQSVRH